VNNAGVAVFAPLMETSDDDWSRVLEVNLRVCPDTSGRIAEFSEHEAD
jgi:NAD(P)-dependent dehydrogenase (short-subunit alcohol dehydrogenase family)